MFFRMKDGNMFLKYRCGCDFVFNLYGRRLKKYLSEEREKMRTLSA